MSDMARMSSEMASGVILSAGGGAFWAWYTTDELCTNGICSGCLTTLDAAAVSSSCFGKKSGASGGRVCLRQGRGAGRCRCGARGCLSSPGRADPAARCCAAPHLPHLGKCRKAPIDPTLWSHSCPKSSDNCRCDFRGECRVSAWI